PSRSSDSRSESGTAVRGNYGTRQIPESSIDINRYLPTFNDTLSKNYGEVKVKGESEFVKRPPDYAHEFIKTLTLISNHYPLRIPKITVYHYDITVRALPNDWNGEGSDNLDELAKKIDKGRQRKLTKTQNRNVIDTFVAQESTRLFWSIINNKPMRPVYDGMKNMYTATPINAIGTEKDACVHQIVHARDEEVPGGFGNFLVTIKVPGENGNDEKNDAKCEVTLREISDYYCGTLPEFPIDAGTALNIILRYGPSASRVAVGANSLNDPNSQHFLLPYGKEFLFGHYQSVRPIAAGMSIVIDRTSSPFVQNFNEDSLINYLLELLKKNHGKNVNQKHIIDLVHEKNPDHDYVSREFKRIHFYTLHLGYKKVYKNFYRIAQSACNQKFPFQREGHDAKMTSVEEYFRTQYGINLEYPHYPCLDFGNKKKSIYIPLEISRLVRNQHYRGKLDGDQTSIMIKETAKEPRERFAHIQKSLLEVKNESAPYREEFQIDIDNKPVRTIGKIISPPKLSYGNTQFTPEGGKWNMKDLELLEGNSLTNWVAISFASQIKNLDHFTYNLKRMAHKMGLNADDPVDSFQAESVNRAIQRVRELEPSFIVWVQDRNDELRKHMKQTFEVTLKGIASQCILSKTYNKMNDQTLANLILKINTKLGGKNHSLVNPPPILKKPGVMIIGADVNHSTPADDIERLFVSNEGGGRFAVSIAALVSTFDQTYFRYYTSVKVQKKERQEMISDLGEMFNQALKCYFNENQKKLPESIIFFRDGVSEGQFRAVLDYEFAHLQKICDAIRKKVKPEFKPKITFIIVQKRNHTRFRPQDPREGHGKMRNVPPGTLVDTTVIHPRNWDYYLISHEGIQGTSVPTHYYVLKDENQFTADELYKLTYFLCHTYSNASRAISIPAPVKYADLAAFRAREHIRITPEIARESSPPQNEDKEQRAQRFGRIVGLINREITIDDQFRRKMYFC
ncbi:Protein argonaute-3-like protein, partial [Dinothrombium tinctorium]